MESFSNFPYVSEVIVATGQFEASVDFWHESLGLQLLDWHEGPEGGLPGFWAEDDRRVGRRVRLGAPRGLTSVHLVEVLEPGGNYRERAWALDALPKTLNFLVRDLPRVWDELTRAGVVFRGPWVEYEKSGVRYRDAHIIGPDHTGIGLLEIVDASYLVNHRSIGEPASFTFTIENMDAECEFYRSLGGQLQLDEYFSGPAIEALVGLPEGGQLHMCLFGPEASVARIELVSYETSMYSHYEHIQLPVRGVLGIVVGGVVLPAGSGRDTVCWGQRKLAWHQRSPAGARVTCVQ